MTEEKSSTRDAGGPSRAFVGVGAAFGLVLWFFVFSLPFLAAAAVVGRSHPRFSSFLGFLGLLSVVPGVLWVARSRWGADWRRALPLAPVRPALVAWTILCVLALQPLEFAWFGAMVKTFGAPSLADPRALVGVAGVVLGAPLAEEVLFRGYGLARIRELGGERRALLFTATVFALLHGHWIKFPTTLAVGLFLGWLVLRSGSLWPALLAHLANNALALVPGRLWPPWVHHPESVSWPLLLAGGAVGAAGLALLGSAKVRSRISAISALP